MTPTIPLARLAPRETRRLAIGLVLSMLVHLLFVAGFGPARRPYVGVTPLQVEIRQESPPQPASEMAVERPLPELPAPAPVARPQEPVPHEAGPPVPARPSAPVELDSFLDKYFTAQELDVRAELLNEVDLVYPLRAYQMRLRGTVVVRIFIDQRGAIDEVSILEANPPGFFEEAALAAVNALQFKPAQKYGRNVKSQKMIEVTFDPYESIRPR